VATANSGTPSLLSELAQRIERLQVKARIAEVRKRAGLTQPELGDALAPPVHWRTIQDWESQRNDTVPFRHLESIAEVTGTTTAWLLHGEEPVDYADLAAARHDELIARLDALAEAQRVMAAHLESIERRP
jgi:transcriptional regulator with XRE-family HTH domain